MFLRGDGGVQLQELMDVIGRLKEGGIEKVGIVAGAATQEAATRPMDAVSRWMPSAKS